MTDCVFCKIIEGALPAYKIYEDAETMAFLSNAGDFYGHTLVVPKRHCESILDCDDATLAAVMRTTQRVARHFRNNCGFDGVNTFINNGAAADQLVFHLHVHVVPRKSGVPHVWRGKNAITRDFEAEKKALQC
jgi:histidine triad (HIT) family protein